MAIKRELLLIVALLLVIAVLVKLVEFFQVNVVDPICIRNGTR